jgi:hypothetical protein
MTDFGYQNIGSVHDEQTQNSSMDLLAIMNMNMNTTQSQYEGNNNQGASRGEGGGRLETIMEESSNLQSNFQREVSYKGGSNSNYRSVGIVNNFMAKGGGLGEKLEMISQEIDQMCEETQKLSEKKIINEGKGNMTNLSNPVPFGGNINRISVAQSVNNSANMHTKNTVMKGSATPNSASVNNCLNPKGVYLNQSYGASTTTMKTKGKGSLGLSNGYLPDYRTNPSSDYTHNFINQTDRMIHSTVIVMEDYKTNFCAMVDREKTKFIHNAEVIRDILAHEYEFNYHEEEKNRVLDSRMEVLFNDMMNLLNEFQNLFNN